jgi:hypothetical protein
MCKERTIVAAQEKVEDSLQTKDTQEVPTDAGHPPGIHVSRGHTGLEHALELDSQREREFHCKHD